MLYSSLIIISIGGGCNFLSVLFRLYLIGNGCVFEIEPSPSSYVLEG